MPPTTSPKRGAFAIRLEERAEGPLGRGASEPWCTVSTKWDTLGAATTGYTLLCCVPLFAPLAIIAVIVIHKIVGGLMKPNAANQGAISS